MKNKVKILCLTLIFGVMIIMTNVVSFANESFTLDYLNDPLESSGDSKAKLDYYKMPHAGIRVSYVEYPDNMPQLEQMSDVIVEGTFEQRGEQEILKNMVGHVTQGFTWSTMKVSRVHKGSLKPGDIVTLCEPFYVYEEDGKELVYHIGSYYPAEEGKDYIWFLNKRDYPEQKLYYSLVRAELGRYPLLNNKTRTMKSIFDMSNEDMDLCPGDDTHYKIFFADVAKKYMGITPDLG